MHLQRFCPQFGICLIVLTSVIRILTAAPGDLDLSFGLGGKVTTAIGSGNDYGYSVVAQPDGKILVAGTAATGSTSKFAVVRYLADGSLDAGFGTGGVVTTEFQPQIPSSSNDARSIVLQDDGKILVGGGAWTTDSYGPEPAPSTNFAFARYNQDGSPDLSFGTNGRVITTMGILTNELCQNLRVLKDGKILAVGYATDWLGSLHERPIALARYERDGSPDTTFAGRGWLMTSVYASSSTDRPIGVAVQRDGKMIVAGGSGFGWSVSLMRYHIDGSFDDSFHASIDDTLSQVPNLVVEDDDKILVAGLTYNSSLFIRRYMPNGDPDPTFGTGGKFTTSALNVSHALRLQADGRILVAGQSAGEFALMRVTAAGVLDPSFGIGGVVKTDVGSGESLARGLDILPDGQVVAAYWQRP